MCQSLSVKKSLLTTSPICPQTNEPQISEGIDINDDSILKSQNIDEIKKYAKMVQGAGENDLSEEDIKYGLSYGRSVIVEYLA